MVKYSQVVVLTPDMFPSLLLAHVCRTTCTQTTQPSHWVREPSCHLTSTQVGWMGDREVVMQPTWLTCENA
jgi:hypothetical protein